MQNHLFSLRGSMEEEIRGRCAVRANVSVIAAIFSFFFLAVLTLVCVQQSYFPIPFAEDSIWLAFSGFRDYRGLVMTDLPAAVVGVDNDMSTTLGPYGLGPSPSFSSDGAITLRTYMTIPAGSTATAWFMPFCKVNDFRKYTDDCSQMYPQGLDAAVIATTGIRNSQYIRMKMQPALEPIKNPSLSQVLKSSEFHGRVVESLENRGSSGNNGSLFTPFIHYLRCGPIKKRCESAFDECLQDDVVTMTDSYHLRGSHFIPRDLCGRNISETPPICFKNGTVVVPRARRLLAFQAGLLGRWDIEFINKGISKPVFVELTIVMRPGEAYYKPLFQIALALLYILSVPALFFVVKMVGIITKERYLQRGDIPRIVDELFIGEVVAEALEEAQLYTQSIKLCWLEWKRWWRRRKVLYSQRVSSNNKNNINNNNVNNNNTSLTITDDMLKNFRLSETTALVLSTSSTDGEAGDICRICRMKEPAAELLSPCACKGTSRFIHKACLARWRELTMNPEYKQVCAECKSPYKYEYIADTKGDSKMTVAFRWVPLLPLTLLFGFLPKVITFILYQDNNIKWKIGNMHIVLTSIVLLNSLSVANHCMSIFLEYPRCLTMKIPLIFFLGTLVPLLWGKALCHLSVVFFNTLPTPEPWFVSGTILFTLLVTNISMLTLFVNDYAPRPRMFM